MKIILSYPVKKTSIEAFTRMSDRDLAEGYSCCIRQHAKEVYTFLSSKKTSIEAFSWMSDRDLAEGYSCWIR